MRQAIDNIEAHAVHANLQQAQDGEIEGNTYTDPNTGRVMWVIRVAKEAMPEPFFGGWQVSVLILAKSFFSGQQFSHRNRNRPLLNDTAMFAVQCANMGNATRMRNQIRAISDFAHKVLHTDGFHFRIQAVLQAGFVRCNTGWACILVAFHGLDAAKRKHKTPG